MKTFYFNLLIILYSLSAVAQGGQNLLKPYVTDSAFSIASQYGETKSAYFFGTSFADSAAMYSGNPYGTAKLIKVQKNSLQNMSISIGNIDTGQTIIKLVVISDTINTIEIKCYKKPFTNNFLYEFYHNRYDTSLHLLKATLVKTIYDSSQYFHPYPIALFRKNDFVFLHTVASDTTGYPHCLYDVIDIYTDSILLSNERLNPWASLAPIWLEYFQYAAVDDSGNIITSMQMSHDGSGPPLPWSAAIIKLNKDDYTLRNVLRYEFYDSTQQFYIMMNRVPFITKHRNNYYYATQSSINYYPNTDVNGQYSSFRIGYFKSKEDLNIYRMEIDASNGAEPAPFFANNPQPDFSHILTSGEGLVMINDTTFLDVHACNFNDGTANFRPWQPERSALQINIIDTNLVIKKTFHLYDPDKNSSAIGFSCTKEGNIIIYGNRCLRGESPDSAHLFAVLLNINTGFPLNIFNAEGIINPFAAKVYPNPFSNELIVETNVIEASIRMVNTIGQEILYEKMNGKKTTITTDGLPPGLYIYNIKDKNNNFINTGKLLKQ